jgi:hypothetical protein
MISLTTVATDFLDGIVDEAGGIGFAIKSMDVSG